jgi:hypothetical protein
LTKTRLTALFQEFFDDTGNIARLKGMEIQAIAQRKHDRRAERRVRIIGCSFSLSSAHKKKGKKNPSCPSKLSDFFGLR